MNIFLLHKVNCSVITLLWQHFHVFIDTLGLPSLRLVPSPEKTSKKLIEELSSHTAASETNSVKVSTPRRPAQSTLTEYV